MIPRLLVTSRDHRRDNARRVAKMRRLPCYCCRSYRGYYANRNQWGERTYHCVVCDEVNLTLPYSGRRYLVPILRVLLGVFLLGGAALSIITMSQCDHQMMSIFGIAAILMLVFLVCAGAAIIPAIKELFFDEVRR